jgi:hypothetical protein
MLDRFCQAWYNKYNKKKREVLKWQILLVLKFQQ